MLDWKCRRQFNQFVFNSVKLSALRTNNRQVKRYFVRCIEFYFCVINFPKLVFEKCEIWNNFDRFHLNFFRGKTKQKTELSEWRKWKLLSAKDMQNYVCVWVSEYCMLYVCLQVVVTFGYINASHMMKNTLELRDI